PYTTLFRSGRYLVVALLAGQVQRVAEVVVGDGPVRHDFEPLPGEVLHGIVKVDGRPAAGAVLTLILPPHCDSSTVVGRWMAANFTFMLTLTSDARIHIRFHAVPIKRLSE